ncbi:MAG: PadR family transcriptional regulator [Acidimicrobiales bacterium]
MGRGAVRPLLLIALLDGPAHGYEVIRRLEELSRGIWRPSPGSVYPTLQMLEDAEVLVGQEAGGKRVYSLTEVGRAEAESARAIGLGKRWEAGANPDDVQRADLRTAVGDLHVAARQVREVASPEQMENAVAIIREARQRLYQLLIES